MTSAEWTPWLSASAQVSNRGGQPVFEHGGENLNHLAIAFVAAGELAPHAFDCSRQHTQSLNGAPFLSAPGLRTRTGT